MNERLSPSFITGGGGEDYANSVAAIYLSNLLTEGTLAGVDKGEIQLIRFQTRRLGFNLDDLLVTFSEGKLALQIKHRLQFIKSDKAFKESIIQAWDTYHSNAFDQEKDTLGIIIGNYSEKIEHFNELIILAKDAHKADEFFNDVYAGGYVNQEKRNILGIIKTILTEHSLTTYQSEEQLWLFIKSLVAIHFKVNSSGEGYLSCIGILKNLYINDRTKKARGLFHIIRSLAGDYNTNGASVNLAKLVNDLKGKADLEKFEVPVESVKKEQKFEKYLTHIRSLREYKDGIDDKPLSTYYVQNTLSLEYSSSWELDEFQEMSSREWNINEFLNGEDWFILIGASFGMGKTSFVMNLASNFANTCLSDPAARYKVIPILVRLRNGLRTTYYENDLDFVISEVIKPIQNTDTQIIVILDGLDEYNNTIEHFKASLYQLHQKYPNIKFVITTRLKAGIPADLNIEKFVRLSPFTKSQVNSFFRKSKASIRYNDLVSIGLKDPEIRKPLISRMLSIIKEDIYKIGDSSSQFARRALIYQTFIHELIRGKHKSQAAALDWKHFYVDEKKVQRKMAALKEIFKDNLSNEKLTKGLEKYGIDTTNVTIEPILTSYTRIRTTESSKLVDFIHESFKEYLLAEYYLESILENAPHRLIIDLPSEETIQFLAGLVEGLAQKDFPKSHREYMQNVIKSYESATRKIEDLEHFKKILSENACSTFQNESIILKQDSISSKDGWSIFALSTDTGVLWIHSWICMHILNKLKIKLEKERLVKLIVTSSHLIPSHLKSLKLVDLSAAHLPRVDLSGANLEGANLSGAYLQGANLEGANLSGANLNDANLSGANLEKAKFVKTQMKGTSLIGAKVDQADFTKAKMNKANLCGLVSSSLERLKPDTATLHKKESLCETPFVDFTNAELKHSRMDGSILPYSVFKNADLTNAFCFGANLRDCDFSGSKLVRSNLSGANLIRSKFVGETTNLSGADLSGATLAAGKFTKGNLGKANLRGSNLSEADLSGANLSGADLRGSRISGTKLKGVTIDEQTRTEGVQYSDSDLDDMSPKLRKLILGN